MLTEGLFYFSFVFHTGPLWRASHFSVRCSNKQVHRRSALVVVVLPVTNNNNFEKYKLCFRFTRSSTQQDVQTPVLSMTE